jgi:hypothetical protein
LALRRSGRLTLPRDQTFVSFEKTEMSITPHNSNLKTDFAKFARQFSATIELLDVGSLGATVVSARFLETRL